VAGDHGAHGRFDARSSATSPQVWFSKHRVAVGVLAGCAAALGLVGLTALSRSQR
jgi:hypothetical protein